MTKIDIRFDDQKRERQPWDKHEIYEPPTTVWDVIVVSVQGTVFFGALAILFVLASAVLT